MKPSRLIGHVSAPAPRYLLRLSVLEKIFAEHLPADDFSVIEFGPGLGDVCSFLKNNPRCKEISLVDFSKETLEALQTRFSEAENIRYLNDDLKNVPEDESYNLILAFEVLEHIVEDVQAFAKLFALTSVGGQFIMSVPAYQKKWQKQDEYAGHVRRYERDELQAKLSNAGFSQIEIIDYGFPLTALMYPFRQAIYNPDVSSSRRQRTQRSGTDRPFFSRFKVGVLYPLYLPFIVLQNKYLNRDLGDGFIAIAKRA